MGVCTAVHEYRVTIRGDRRRATTRRRASTKRAITAIRMPLKTRTTTMLVLKMARLMAGRAMNTSNPRRMNTSGTSPPSQTLRTATPHLRSLQITATVATEAMATLEMTAALTMATPPTATTTATPVIRTTTLMPRPCLFLDLQVRRMPACIRGAGASGQSRIAYTSSIGRFALCVLLFGKY